MLVAQVKWDSANQIVAHPEVAVGLLLSFFRQSAEDSESRIIRESRRPCNQSPSVRAECQGANDSPPLVDGKKLGLSGDVPKADDTSASTARERPSVRGKCEMPDALFVPFE